MVRPFLEDLPGKGEAMMESSWEINARKAGNSRPQKVELEKEVTEKIEIVKCTICGRYYAQ
jgi:hypothetical protein